MGAHSLKTTSPIRRVAAGAALAAGAAVAAVGAGQAAATPMVVDVPAHLQFEGVPSQFNFDLPEGVALPEGFEIPAGSVAEAGGDQQHIAEFAAPAAPEVTKGDRIVESAKTRLGSPYVWGATGPNSFDCSGLTSWAYAQQGVSIPRTSQAQIAGGTPVARNALQPGDIVAFYSGATHVGLYVGNNTVIHAPYSGTSVSYAPLDSMPFYGATRY